jgi:hypothetical protein
MKRLTTKAPATAEPESVLGDQPAFTGAIAARLKATAALADRLKTAIYQVDAGLVMLDPSSIARGPAIDRLAGYENVHVDLLERQAQLAIQLEALRAKGQTKTVQFRELLGEKLMNSHLLNLLKIYGLEIDPDDE